MGSRRSRRYIYTAQLDELMEGRQVYAVHAGETERLQPVEAVGRYASVGVPILVAGDVTGAVVFVQPGSGTIPSEGDIRLAQVAATFLGKQMEE